MLKKYCIDSKIMIKLIQRSIHNVGRNIDGKKQSVTERRRKVEDRCGEIVAR